MTATAEISTHKNLGNTRIAYKPRPTHTDTPTHLDTRSQKKHRWQLVTQIRGDEPSGSIKKAASL